MGLLSSSEPKKAGLLSNTYDAQGAAFFAPGFGAPVSTQNAQSTQALPDEKSKAAGEFIPRLAQATVRSAATVGAATGQVIAEAISPEFGARARSVTPVPTGLMAKAIGSEPVDTSKLAETAASYESGLKKIGLGGGVGTGIAVLGSVLPDALLFTGLGGEARVGKALLEADTAAKAASVLKKEGVPPVLIPRFKELFAQAGTKAEVDAGLTALKEAYVTSKPIPETLAPLAEKAKTMTVDEFTTQFEKGLTTQNLTFRDTAENTLREMKAAGFTTPEEFYNATKRLEDSTVIPKTANDFIAEQNLATSMKISEETRQKALAGLMEDKRLAEETPKTIYRVSDGPIKEGDFVSDSVAKVEEYKKLRGDTAQIHTMEVPQNTLIKGARSGEYIYAPTSNSLREPMAQVVPGEADARPIQNTLPEETTPVSVPETTSPALSASLDKVKHLSVEIATPFTQALEIGAKTTREPALFNRVSKKMSDAFTTFTEYVQNADVRVKQLLERTDVSVTDTNNAYQKATLYPGRVATKIEEAKAEMEDIANRLVDIADTTGKDVSIIRADANEYMQALHAPERNAALGKRAAGMSDAEAKAVVERIKSSPEGAAVRAVAEQAKKLNEQGLILLRDAGVISDDLYKTLTTKYKNHVPLQRIMDSEEITGALAGRGFDVRSTGIKKAVGSEREVADILSNIQHNYEQAVLRSEKNMVDQATLQFVRDNKEALDGLMEVYRPRVIGRRIDDFKNFDNAEGALIKETTNDPRYLQMYENGKPVWVKINDPALAVAIRGMGREKIPALLNAVGAYTRFYAGLATRFNPEFALPNKIRDLQETMIYLAAQKDVGFKGAGKLVLKDPASMKAVFDSIRGENNAGTKLYEEMKSLGGTTGGFGLSTRQKTELDFNKMLETAQSTPKKAGKELLQYIDHWNTIFEDSTRLSVYKQALGQGASKERAAFLAKEASINFNRMGRGGPVINALWMFSNASIQGSAKMIRSLKNPKVLAAVITTIGTSVAAVNEWNDHVDPKWRDKVTKWDRLNSLPIMLPTEDGKGTNYFVIPVSWGVKPIKVMADYAYDAASGIDLNMGTAASDLFASMANAYNPLGGTDAVSALVPTILDMPVDIARNQSWSGSKIRPDFDKNAPADVQYFKALGETASGKAFIEGTKKLQESTGIAISPADINYAFENLIGGAGKTGLKTGNSVISAASGKPPSADQYPFLSRFYRNRSEEEVGMGAGGDTSVLKNVLQEQSRERFYVTQTAEDNYAKLKEMPPEEASAKWEQINKDSPELGAKIADIAKQDKKGLNYTERLVAQLGVENGARALYVVSQLNELKTNEEKGALWKDYTNKGILTPQVADQVSYLLKNPQ